VRHMWRSATNVSASGAQIILSEEDFALSMVQRAHRHATLMDANKSVNGGECQRHGAVVKRCRMEGCRNQVVKGGGGVFGMGQREKALPNIA